MALDYLRRLENIQNRRFDPELRESVLSKSFGDLSVPKSVKYMMESMKAIDSTYNNRTIEAAKRVQGHMEGELSLHFRRAYRTQGSISTATNIKVHSDFDLLTIIDRYYYLAPELPNNYPYTDSDPNEDIKSLRQQTESILKRKYDEVDTTGNKGISIFNKNLNRKVDVVFCYWYNTKKYEETNNEFYRGVYLYDFPKSLKIKDFPFAHISNVNYKGDQTNDGSRKAIRLLKSLNADSSQKIDLNGFLLTTVVHSIDDTKLLYTPGMELNIAEETSAELNKLINDETYRKSIKSPNGTEQPFTSAGIVPELVKIKQDLDDLIQDVQNEAYYGHLRSGNIIYS
jgi:hypothetical protein